MNELDGDRVYFRSVATRHAGHVVPDALDDMVAACKVAGYDLVIVETPGIGQGDATIVDHVDWSLYVMTAEFGAPSQLEKIDMLDFADAVAINKFDRRGAEDALRDVRRQLQRNRESFGSTLEDLPVFGTVASRFDDDGVTALYQCLADALVAHGLPADGRRLPLVSTRTSSRRDALVPTDRVRYLAEIAETVRGYHTITEAEVAAARARQHVATTLALLRADSPDGEITALEALAERTDAALDPTSRELLDGWPATRAAYSGPEQVVEVSGARFAPRSCARRRRASTSRAWRCLGTATTAGCCAGSVTRTFPDGSRSRVGSSPSSAKAKTPRGCSPGRATRCGPTGVSICWPRASRRRGCRRRSIR
jgi:methylmalonyl-CoA mutase